jgi:hypothetical protein
MDKTVYEMSFTHDVQELTAQAIELNVYRRLFEEENMSREEILKLFAEWAEEFHEKYKGFKWNGETSYYDEMDKFVTKKDHDYNNPYIDQYGEIWDGESEDHCWPAGGGLHKDCDYNAEALYAYYVIKSEHGVYDYLIKRGFRLVGVAPSGGNSYYRKGNTEIIFECYDYTAHQYGYLHTELLTEESKNE